MLEGPSEREPVPRWRSYRATLEHGELRPLGIRTPMRRPTAEELDLARRVHEWKAAGTPSYATDVLNAAIFSGDKLLIREAAIAVRDSGVAPGLGRSLAMLALGELDRDVVSPGAHTGHDSFEEEGVLAGASIAEIRRSLRRDQRNAIAWAELSRLHAITANRESARRSMLIALELAPQSRFVLRSASRLAVHLDDPEWGHDLLRRAPRTSIDPWLASAEIATAALSHRPSRLIKPGRRMLESESFSKRDTAELAAALGTREMDASRRRAKHLFVEALEDPTENALAQAVWAASAMNWQDLDFALADKPESFEAKARALAIAGDRSAAAAQSWGWFDEEPFATEPPMFGSYQASADQDYSTGVEFARKGLRSNPDDAGLLNNIAFCLASGGDVDRARPFFNRIRLGAVESDSERAVYTATRGLLNYRSGHVEAGRRDYSDALELFGKDPYRRALAAIMFAREEVRAQTPLGLDLARRAVELEREAEDKGVPESRHLRSWLRELEQFMREYSENSNPRWSAE